MVLCLQGFNTRGRLTDSEGRKAGWQQYRGDQGDRDLKFFNAVLADLRKAYLIEDRRVHAMGHSNGGIPTYLQWATRGDVFAPVAHSVAAAPRLLWLLKGNRIFRGIRSGRGLRGGCRLEMESVPCLSDVRNPGRCG